MKRRLLKLAVLLVLGAIVNVAVAWGCAIWSPLGNWINLSQIEWADHLRSAHGVVASDFRMVSGGRRNGFGLQAIDHFEQSKSDLTAITPIGGLLGPFEYSAGWPRHSLAGTWVNNDEPTDGWFVPAPLQTAGPVFLNYDRIVPRRPLWPGFAVNTIFYAAILWALFFAPGKIRRLRRIKRNLCPACAYPVGESDVCTECGGKLHSSWGARAERGLQGAAAPCTRASDHDT